MKHHIIYFSGKKVFINKDILQNISKALDGENAIWLDEDFPSMSEDEDKKIKEMLKQFKLDKKVSKSIDKLLK